MTSLAEARDKAWANRKLARQGGNPVAERQRENRNPTFRRAAEGTHRELKGGWRNKKTEQVWLAALENHAFPILGDMRVRNIGREDVLRVLKPLYESRPDMARRVRQRIRRVLGWCEAYGYVDGNVAGDAIREGLPAVRKARTHLRALPHHEVSAALQTVEASGASIAAKLCFRLIVLTAVRNGEARHAAWSEVNLKKRVWIVPAERTKSNREHRIPLSREAVSIFEEARVLQDDTGLVFPSPRKRGAPLSDMALTKVLRDNGLADRATMHGFRSSFRDWCAETGKPRELAEAALSHVVGGVEGAYFRSDLFEKRRELMDAWTEYVVGVRGNVVALRG